MKLVLAGTLSVFALSACGGGSHSSSGNPQAGHMYAQQCSPRMIQDMNSVAQDCQVNGYNSQVCNDASASFNAHYSNMQCSYDDGSTKLDYSDVQE